MRYCIRPYESMSLQQDPPCRSDVYFTPIAPDFTYLTKLLHPITRLSSLSPHRSRHIRTPGQLQGPFLKYADSKIRLAGTGNYFCVGSKGVGVLSLWKLACTFEIAYRNRVLLGHEKEKERRNVLFRGFGAVTHHDRIVGGIAFGDGVLRLRQLNV